MLSGDDVTIDTPAGKMALEFAVRALSLHWPNASFEDASLGQSHDRFSDIPFGMVDELFVYRDSESRDSWREQGAGDSNRNTMVHLMADDTGITVVVDELDPEMDSLVEAIRQALHDNLFLVRAAA